MKVLKHWSREAVKVPNFWSTLCLQSVATKTKFPRTATRLLPQVALCPQLPQAAVEAQCSASTPS